MWRMRQDRRPRTPEATHTIQGEIVRTTSLQVSGYRFLLRRLELALVIGDPRMAHDPLRAQRRSIGVGLLLSALIAGGAVMLSLLRPAPSIDDAALVADETFSRWVSGPPPRGR